MTNETKHTPTPWDICESGNSNLIHIECAAGTAGNPITGLQIATVNKGTRAERLANAHHIVKCANSHDELLTALKVALNFWDHNLASPQEKEAWIRVRAAIARAEKGDNHHG